MEEKFVEFSRVFSPTYPYEGSCISAGRYDVRWSPNYLNLGQTLTALEVNTKTFSFLAGIVNINLSVEITAYRLSSRISLQKKGVFILQMIYKDL